MNGMSDSIYAHDTAAAELFAAGDGNLFQRVMQLHARHRPAARLSNRRPSPGFHRTRSL
jgi:hypothetical protein